MKKKPPKNPKRQPLQVVSIRGPFGGSARSGAKGGNGRGGRGGGGGSGYGGSGSGGYSDQGLSSIGPAPSGSGPALENQLGGQPPGPGGGPAHVTSSAAPAAPSTFGTMLGHAGTALEQLGGVAGAIGAAKAGYNYLKPQPKGMGPPPAYSGPAQVIEDSLGPQIEGLGSQVIEGKRSGAIGSTTGGDSIYSDIGDYAMTGAEDVGEAVVEGVAEDPEVLLGFL